MIKMVKSTAVLALVFTSLLVMASIAQGGVLRPTPIVGRPDPKIGVPLCHKFHAVEGGETCVSMAQRFKVYESHFLEINPNINCALLFVGQWVCVDGTLF